MQAGSAVGASIPGREAQTGGTRKEAASRLEEEEVEVWAQ